MVEMTEQMQRCFDNMDDEQKIRMFYELTKYMHENMELQISMDIKESN